MNEQQAFMELVDTMVAAYQKLIPFVDLERMATILPQSASVLANVETKKKPFQLIPLQEESTRLAQKFIAQNSMLPHIYMSDMGGMMNCFTCLHQERPKEVAIPEITHFVTLPEALRSLLYAQLMMSTKTFMNPPITQITPNRKVLFIPPGFARICITTKMYDLLSVEERDAIYLHELGHHMYVRVQSAMEMLNATISIAVIINLFVHLAAISVGLYSAGIGAVAIMGILVCVAISLHIRAFLSRRAEYAADDLPIALGQGLYFKSAFDKVKKHEDKQLNETFGNNKVLRNAVVFLVNALNVILGLDTHPSMQKRMIRATQMTPVRTDGKNPVPVPRYLIASINQNSDQIQQVLQSLLPYDGIISSLIK